MSYTRASSRIGAIFATLISTAAADNALATDRNKPHHEEKDPITLALDSALKTLGTDSASEHVQDEGRLRYKLETEIHNSLLRDLSQSLPAFEKDLANKPYNAQYASGDGIKAVQRILNALDGVTNSVDGVAGPKTAERLVVALEEMHFSEIPFNVGHRTGIFLESFVPGEYAALLDVQLSETVLDKLDVDIKLDALKQDLEFHLEDCFNKEFDIDVAHLKTLITPTDDENPSVRSILPDLCTPYLELLQDTDLASAEKIIDNLTQILEPRFKEAREAIIVDNTIETLKEELRNNPKALEKFLEGIIPPSEDNLLELFEDHFMEPDSPPFDDTIREADVEGGRSNPVNIRPRTFDI